MLQENDIKEGISKAYVRDICNSAGYNLSTDDKDYGFDITVKDIIKRDGNRFVYSGHNLDIQLKSTTNIRKNNFKIIYDLKNKNYNDLINTDCATPRILVVLCLPDDSEDWVKQDINSLVIKNCAFWYYLGGKEKVENEESKTALHIPEKNIFSVENLNKIMDIVKKRGDLSAL